jgi:hypothetical protein
VTERDQRGDGKALDVGLGSEASMRLALIHEALDEVSRSGSE